MFNISDTQESIAIRELKQMNSYASAALDSLIEQTALAYQCFWFAGASPALKLQLLGTQAIDVFTKHAAVQEFIKSVRPTYEVLGIPNGYVLTWSEDGSATLSGEYIPPIDPAIVEDQQEELPTE